VWESLSRHHSSQRRGLFGVLESDYANRLQMTREVGYDEEAEEQEWEEACVENKG